MISQRVVDGQANGITNEHRMSEMSHEQQKILVDFCGNFQLHPSKARLSDVAIKATHDHPLTLATYKWLTNTTAR